MSGLIKFSVEGDLSKTERFLLGLKSRQIYKMLDIYGKKGVEALRASTPKRTGATANSWSYRVVMEHGEVGIEWLNSNKADDGRTPVAILIQMGHGTGTGGYVPPVDFINPTMQPLFDEIVAAIEKAVKSL